MASLHSASKRGDVNALLRLLDDPSVDIRSTDVHGNSVLHLAARYGHLEIVEVVHNVACNQAALHSIRNNEEMTASEVALLFQHHDVFSALSKYSDPAQSVRHSPPPIIRKKEEGSVTAIKDSDIKNSTQAVNKSEQLKSEVHKNLAQLCADLTEQLDLVSGRNARLENEMEVLKGRWQETQDENQILNTVRDRSTEQAVEMKSRSSEMEKALKAERNRGDTLKEDNDNLERVHAKLMTQVSDLRAELEGERARARLAVEENQDLLQMQDKITGQLEVMRGQCLELSEEMEALQQKSRGQGELNVELSAAKAEVKEQLDEMSVLSENMLSENKLLKSKSHTQAAELQAALQDRAQLNTQVMEMKIVNVKMEEELKEMHRQSQSHLMEFERLSAEKVQTKFEVIQSTEAVGTAMAKIRAQSDVTDTLTNSNFKLNTQVKHLTTQVQQLENELSSARAELLKAEASVTDTHNMMRKQQGELNTKTDTVNELAQKNFVLADDIERIRNENTVSNIKLAKLQEEFDTLSKHHIMLQSQFQTHKDTSQEDLMKLCQGTEQSNKQLTEKTAELETMKVSHRSELSALRADLTDVTARNIALMRDHQALKDSHQELEKRLDSTELKSVQLEEYSRLLASEKAGKQREVEAAGEEFKELSAKHQTALAQQATLQESLQEASLRLEEHKSNFTQLQGRMRELQQEKEKVEGERASYRDELTETIAKNTELEKSFKSLQTRHVEQSSLLEETQMEVAQLKLRVSAMESEKEAAEDQLGAFRKECTHLTLQQQILTTKYDNMLCTTQEKEKLVQHRDQR